MKKIFFWGALALMLNFSCKRKCTNSVCILDYGADTTRGFNNAVAIQKAINENPGRQIIFPAGKYEVHNEIVVHSSVELVGEGQSNTILQPVNCNGFVIKAGGVTVKNMFIYGSDDSPDSTPKIAIYCLRINKTLIENVTIQNFTTGIELDSSGNTIIDKVIITFNHQLPQMDQGIKIHGQSVNNFISNCQINAKSIGIRIKPDTVETRVLTPEGLFITNTLISQCKAGIYSEGILSLHVSNCMIDLITEYALHLKKTTGLLLTNTWIAPPHSNNPDSADEQAIYLDECSDCHISNNNLKTFDGARVISILNGSHDNIFTNNTIELGNSNGIHIYLDSSANYNMIKDNTLTWTISSITRQPLIRVNDINDRDNMNVRGNIIKDNLHYDN